MITWIASTPQLQRQHLSHRFHVSSCGALSWRLQLPAKGLMVKFLLLTCSSSVWPYTSTDPCSFICASFPLVPDLICACVDPFQQRLEEHAPWLQDQFGTGSGLDRVDLVFHHWNVSNRASTAWSTTIGRCQIIQR